MTQPHDPFELCPSLDQAIQEIAAMTAPPEATDRVTAAVLNRTSKPLSSPPPRRLGVLGRRTVLAAIALTCLAAASTLFFDGTPFTQVAFAQVQQELGKTQSVQYVEYMHEVDAKNEVQLLERMLASDGLAADAKTMQLEPDELRKRIQARVADIQGQLTRGEPVVFAHVWIQGRYLFRREQTLGIGKSVEVIDEKGVTTVLLPGMYFQRIEIVNAETGENVHLEPDRKRCVSMRSHTSINQHSGKTTRTEMGPNPASNFYTAYRDILPANLTAIEEKSFDGKTASGFRKVENQGEWQFTTTYWIDSSTKLPVRMDAEMRQNGKLMGGTTIANIVFDQKINPSLFETKPPVGYAVSESGIIGIDVSQPDEK